MQDDFADLCAFYPSMKDAETCLDLLSGWAEFSQDHPPPPPPSSSSLSQQQRMKGGEGNKKKKEKDKKKRRDLDWMAEEGGEEEVRDAWRDDVLHWLYMEENDFFSGKTEGPREGESEGGQGEENIETKRESSLTLLLPDIYIYVHSLFPSLCLPLSFHT